MVDTRLPVSLRAGGPRLRLFPGRWEEPLKAQAAGAEQEPAGHGDSLAPSVWPGARLC